MQITLSIHSLAFKPHRKSCQEIEKICQYLHLNNRENELPWENPAYDKLFKVQPLLDEIANTFREEYEPLQFVSIDKSHG